MPHLFEVADERPDARKELPEFGALAETVHMPVDRVPLDPQDERRRLFHAPAQFEAEAVAGSAQRVAGRRIRGNELVGLVGRYLVADVFDHHRQLRSCSGKCKSIP